MHIEVLQEKIDDLEKESSKFKLRLQEAKQQAETRFRDEFNKKLEQKQDEIDMLKKELKKNQDFVN